MTFFKRTKYENWETKLLIKIIEKLPEQYLFLKEQVENGLIKKVFIGSSVIPNYVGFSYNPLISRKYEDKKGRFFKLSGIFISDFLTGEFVEIEIFISHGLIMGYSIPQKLKIKPDLTKIKVDNFKRTFFDNADFQKISHLLGKKEISLINPSDVYEVILNGKSFFNIKNLEDGNFIGIDLEKHVYVITHDPFEIKLLNKDLTEVLI